MNTRRTLFSIMVTAAVVGVFVLAGLLVVGLGWDSFGGPQNTFAPAGAVADLQRDIFIYALIPAIMIFIGVEAAVIYVLVRYRRQREDEPPPPQTHGNQRLELAWTIAPALLLLGLAVPVIMGISEVGRDPSDDALEVDVFGQVWSWSFQYPQYTTADDAPVEVTGGSPPTFFIPAGREIAVNLHSRDVIHSFWVPKLAGKLDVMPGQTNTMWFKADQPGYFPGQCAEFCGLQHYDMKFAVCAVTQEEFDRWINEQTSGAAPDEPRPCPYAPEQARGDGEE